MQSRKLWFIYLLPFILVKCKTDAKTDGQQTGSLSMRKILVDNLITNIKYRDTITMGKEMVLTDENDNKIHASTLFGSYDKLLFFYYSKSFCDLCLDREMDKLNKIKGEYSKKIIILLSVDNKNELRLYKNRYHSKFRFYGVGETVFSKKVNLLFRPYYFIADRNFNTSMLFIPDKNVDEPTEAYLKAVFTD